MTSPIVLNFTLEEELTIKYIMNYPERVDSIKLNPNNSIAYVLIEFSKLKKII